MTYRIEITQAIQAQIDEQVSYYLHEGVSVPTVIGWLDGLYVKLEALQAHPRLYTVASWPSKAKGIEIRRLIYGEHVLYYRVHEDTRIVEAVSFRHSKRCPWLEDKD